MWQGWGRGVTNQLTLADWGKLRVGMVELVCVGRLLRMSCGPFLMPVCGFVGGGEIMGAEWATMGTFC